MNNGENYEFDDNRLTYIYNELVKSIKFKHDTWTTMLKTPEFNVCIYIFMLLSCYMFIVYSIIYA